MSRYTPIQEIFDAVDRTYRFGSPYRHMEVNLQEIEINCYDLNASWVTRAVGSWLRGKEPSMWLALLNGTDWNSPSARSISQFSVAHTQIPRVVSYDLWLAAAGSSSAK